MPTRVTLCPESDFPPDTMRRYQVPDGMPLAIYNLGGTFHASDDNCPHKGASLSAGFLEDGHVICPWHQGAYDVRTGRAAAPPCVTPLPLYPVTVENGMVVVTLPD